MLPGIAYYLSRWYKKDELVFRLGVSADVPHFELADAATALRRVCTSGRRLWWSFGQ
jgi:hypothetical protein